MAEPSYAVHGPRDGPVVLLVHGFPFDRAMWRFQVGPLTAAGYRAVVPDLPGFGRSEELGVAGQPAASVEAMADALLAVLDRAKAAKAVVVGFSMGGYAALALAAKAPDRVAGLVLADTRAEADAEQAKAKRDTTIAQVQASGTRALAAAMLGSQLTEATRNTSRLLAEEVRGMMLRQPKATVVAALQAMRDRPDRRDLLPTLPAPVLVLVGEHDQVTPLDSAKTLLGASRDGELKVIPGAAHLTPMEAPDEVNEALLDWLGRRFPAGR